jgi:hypothetical protein
LSSTITKRTVPMLSNPAYLCESPRLRLPLGSKGDLSPPVWHFRSSPSTDMPLNGRFAPEADIQGMRLTTVSHLDAEMRARRRFNILLMSLSGFQCDDCPKRRHDIGRLTTISISTQASRASPYDCWA